MTVFRDITFLAAGPASERSRSAVAPRGGSRMRRCRTFLGLLFATVFWLAVPWPSGAPMASAQGKADKAEAAKKELAALQGTWKWVAFEEGGKGSPIKEETFYVIHKDKVSVKNKDKVTSKGTVS